MIDISEIIEHTCEQRSDAWFNLRSWKLTGSHFAEIMPCATDIKKGVFDKWTLAQMKVIYRIAAEILTGQADRSFYVSDAMQWGIDHEEEARRAVELHLMMVSRECGIFQRGQYIASSPDAILGDNDLTLELKCPSSAVHLKYLKDSEALWSDYKWQTLGEFYCSGLDAGLIASYDPRFKDESKQLVIYEPVDYMDDLKRLEDRLGEVEIKIEELLK